MLRLVALSLLALAAPHTAAEYVPYPLSRELLSGTVNPCDSTYASCPPELERIYRGLRNARHQDDQSLLEYFQRKLRYYYRIRTYRPDLANPCDSTHASCSPELERIYRGLRDARHRDDQSLLEYFQRKLRYYYDNYQP